MLYGLNHKLSEISKWQVVSIGVFLLVIIGYIDYVSGFEISMSFFYVAPIGFVTWYAGKNHGLALSVIAGIVLILAAISAHHDYTNSAILYWNSLLEMALYLLIVILIDKVHTSLVLEVQLASIDTLTKIPNRRKFLEQLDSCLQLARRSEEAFSMAYIDVDNFKFINDNYGHGRGDEVLLLLATALRTHLRCTDIAARLGGDEFAVLLPNTDSDGARHIIEKIQSNIRETFQHQASLVTASMGAVTFELLPKSAAEAIKKADELMYKVKQDGKNSIRFHVST